MPSDEKSRKRHEPNSILHRHVHKKAFFLCVYLIFIQIQEKQFFHVNSYVSINFRLIFRVKEECRVLS
jgi:hypothetical protein